MLPPLIELLHFQVFANAIILHLINGHLHLVTVSLTVSFNVIPNDDCQILKYGTLDPPNKKNQYSYLIKITYILSS